MPEDDEDDSEEDAEDEEGAEVEDDDDDDNLEELAALMAKANAKAKKAKGKQKQSADSEDGSGSEEEEEGWGRNKATYYASNADELASDDDEANEMEEQEAKRLQLKARDILADDDFGFGDSMEPPTELPA